MAGINFKRFFKIFEPGMEAIIVLLANPWILKSLFTDCISKTSISHKHVAHSEKNFYMMEELKYHDSQCQTTNHLHDIWYFLVFINLSFELFK